MAKTSYKNLMAEITKLQKQADMVRKTEVSSVVANIQKTMKTLGLTVNDLQAASATAGRKVRAKTATPAKAAPATAAKAAAPTKTKAQAKTAATPAKSAAKAAPVKAASTDGRKVRAKAANPAKAAAAPAPVVGNAERKRAFSPRRKPEVKFKDPKTGATWTGRGKVPLWMQASLQKGKTKEHFAIR